MKRGVVVGVLVLALLIPLFLAAITTTGRYDDFTTNATIAEFNNVTWQTGNVSFTSNATSASINISQNNTQVISLSEATSIKGIANNGTHLFVNDAGTRIKIALFNGTVLSSHSVGGLAAENNDLAYNGQFLYSRIGDTIYRINLTSNTSTAVNFNSTYGILTGDSWLNGNIFDMPDGRIGTVGSASTNPFTVRLFNVSANGTSFNWSEDINISASWNTDNHGFASDGTYLALISFDSGHKVYNLVNRSEHHANTAWDIRPTGIGNPTFITYDHTNHRILVGDYGDRDFIIFNGGVKSANFVSTTTMTSETILNVTNVSWSTTGESTGNTISVQISVDNATTWYTATNNQRLSQNFDNQNRSLLYRVLFSADTNSTLTIDSISLNWTQGNSDASPPLITIHNPTNATYFSLPIIFNISSNENSTAWYSLNNGRNVSLLANNSGTGFTQSNNTLLDGNYNFTIYLNDTNGNINLSTVVFHLNTSDLDGDGVGDSNDTLLYNESNVTTTGLTQLNITIAGNRTNTSFAGLQDVHFYDTTTQLLNFSYNFSAGTLDLSKIRISKTSTSLLVNMSGQLNGITKTLYIDNDNYASLCVKDADISSIDAMASDCTGTNETVFTTCLGNSTGLTINGITCVDSGTRISLSNLTHSAIRGAQAQSSSESSSRSGGGGGSSSSSSSSSSIPTPEPAEVEVIQDGPISVGTKLLQLTLRQGESVTRSISISNPWDVAKSVQFSTDNTKFITPPSKISLEPRTTQNTQLTLHVPRDMGTGIHVQSLFVNDGDIQREILISITVLPHSSLFDIILDLDDNSILTPNGVIVAKVQLLKLIVAQAEDVQIFYRLQFTNGTVIQEYSDTRAVEQKLEYQREIPLPEWITPGDYTLGVQVVYHGETASASVPLRIINQNDHHPLVLATILVSILGVALWYIRTLSKKKR